MLATMAGRPSGSVRRPAIAVAHSRTRVSVCSMRCDTRESARPPSPGPARSAPRRDFVPSDNGCMWGQRAFYERRERESITLSASFSSQTFLLLRFYMPLLHHLPLLLFPSSSSFSSRFSGIGRSLRQSRRVRRSARNYPFAPFLGAASMFLRLLLSPRSLLP